MKIYKLTMYVFIFLRVKTSPKGGEIIKKYKINKKHLENILDNMSYGLSGKNVGVPISAIVIDPKILTPITNKNGEIVKSHNIKMKNSRSKNRCDNYHHAEYICLEELEYID